MTMLASLDGLKVGDNLPYSGQQSAYTIDIHGATAGLPHCVIEVRQDQVSTPAGIATWAARLAEILAKIFASETIHRVQRF